MQIQLGKANATDVVIYEFGCRIDRNSQLAAGDQMLKARRLYNNLVAVIKSVLLSMNAFLLDAAGDDAQRIHNRISILNTAFADAKARNDQAEMRRIAEERRPLWAELRTLLKEARSTHKARLQQDFLSRIGKNSRCNTYKLRCQAVADGLGWATANAILDAALVAFQQAFRLGRAPKFASAEAKSHDVLTLQFSSNPGGVDVNTLFSGKNGDLAIIPSEGCGPRKYGQLRFRLGPASAQRYATGTWQYHRPLPAGARVGLARLIRKRIGKDHRWYVQLQVKLGAIVSEPVGERKSLVAVHFGWSADINGRRVAGIADSADPHMARVLQLPPGIEAALVRTSRIQGERELACNAILRQMKSTDVSTLPAAIRDEFIAICHLPFHFVATQRLHRLVRQLNGEAVVRFEWLETWRKKDQMRWQTSAHLAKRARNVRRDFYRNVAMELARQYQAILLEPIVLAAAAKKVDLITGKYKRSMKNRSGRTIAAIYELESAISWAAAKTGAALLEISGKTATTCAVCHSEGVVPDPKDLQRVRCATCEAVLDRKQNSAASAWQAATSELDSWLVVHRTHAGDAWSKQIRARNDKNERMAQARRGAGNQVDSAVQDETPPE